MLKHFRKQLKMLYKQQKKLDKKHLTIKLELRLILRTKRRNLLNWLKKKQMQRAVNNKLKLI